MADFTLYEYNDIGVTGEPRQPESTKTVGTVGTALLLQDDTAFVVIVPAVDVRFRVSADPTVTAAAASDYKVLTDDATGCEVKPGTANYVHTLAA